VCVQIVHQAKEAFPVVVGKLGGAAFQGRVGKRRGVKLTLFGRLRMKPQLIFQYHEVSRFNAGSATESHSLPPTLCCGHIIIFCAKNTKYALYVSVIMLYNRKYGRTPYHHRY
jgi:hypothetical protein